jgi:hypothetical protein
MLKLFKKVLLAVLDVVAPLPIQEEIEQEFIQEPEPMDPRVAANQMRETARQLYQLADKLDPIFLNFPVPQIPSKWNHFIDEDGTTGGKVKRKGHGIEMGKTQPPTKKELVEEKTQKDIIEELEAMKKYVNLL